jgi:hypothetical protein
MMTNDEIRRMVVENYDPYGQYYLDLYAFVDDLQNAVLEEAAIACDKISEDRWSLYKGRVPYTGQESGRADPYVEGESTGADKCSDAIRAMKTKDQS